MNILLIGGAGYIGSRLSAALEELGHKTIILDANLLSGGGGQDVRTAPVEVAPYDAIVWLASIHDMSGQEEEWQSIAYQLMVSKPLEWATAAAAQYVPFLYFSSTRAGTHPDSQYGWNKARFESIRPRGTTVVRPGTVWGMLDMELPNRTHTIVNRMIVDSAWMPSPGNQPFFTCAMRWLIPRVVSLIVNPDHVMRGLILPVTDQERPITGAALAGGLRPAGFEAEPNPGITELGEHPMELYERYYFPEEV